MDGGPRPSLRGNFLYSAAYAALNIGFPLISFAYIARIMGPDILGRINFAVSLAAIFVLAATLAMPLYGAREIARVRDDRASLDRVFSELFLINLGTTLLALAAYASLFLASDRMQEDRALFAVAGSAIAFNAFTVDWLYQGLENHRFIAWRSLAFKSVSLALLFALVREAGDLLWVAAIGVFSNAAAGMAGFLSSRRFATLSPRPPGSLLVHARSMFTLSASTLLATVYVYLDSVLLGILSGNRAVGLFAAATRAPRVAISLVQSLSAVMIPRLSYYVERGMEAEYRSVARKSLSFVYFISFPAAGLLAALAPLIIRILSGPGFEDAVPAMRIATPLVVLMGFTNFIGLQVIFPNKGDAKLLAATFIGACVNLSLNLLLIPRFAQYGAAAALIAAEAGSAVAQGLMARGSGLGFRLADRVTFRYAAMALLATLAAGATAGLRAPDLVILPAAMLAGIGTYLGGLWLLRDPLLQDIAGMARARLTGSSARERA